MTNNTKTREAHDAYVANRREAGRVIDIETCEIACLRANYFDPYGTDPWDDDRPDDPLYEQARTYWGKCLFVRSEESDGWIIAEDLPEEKWQVLERRMEGERKLKQMPTMLESKAAPWPPATLTIAEAKKALAATFGVKPEAVEISIRG